MKKLHKSIASPGAGIRRVDGMCMKCGKRPPLYNVYPVCQECWKTVCHEREMLLRRGKHKVSRKGIIP